MSFRFRRSIKIIPGVRLNVGKRGMSVSTGVRGARVTFGSSGTRVTAGLPGSGLSYSTKLDVGTSNGRYYDRSTGLSLTKSQVNAELRRQHKERQINEANSAIRREQDQYEHFTKIATYAPEITPMAKWEEGLLERTFTPQLYGIEVIDLQTEKKVNLKEAWSKFLKGWFFCCFLICAGIFLKVMISSDWNPPKESMVLAGVALLAAIIATPIGYKRMKLAREDAIQRAQLRYSEFLKQLEDAKGNHPQNEVDRIKKLKLLMEGEKELVENQLHEDFEDLANEFSELAHSFKTEVSFHIQNRNRVFLDVDLPEIEDVVKTETKTVLKSGKVSEKSKNKRTQNQEYAEGVIGLAFHLAAHTFDATPAITEVIVSGYTQRVNKKTGNIQSDYIYSVRFDRVRFCNLNLKAIDPVESITQFSPKLDLSKTFEFGSVTPYEEQEREFGT